MNFFDGVEWELVRLVQEKREAEKAARVAFKKELARNLRIPWRKANPKPERTSTPISEKRRHNKEARERLATNRIQNEEIAKFTAQQITKGEEIIARLIAEGKMK